MEPGRELDEEIAKILGWTSVEDGFGVRDRKMKSIPNYSTDWAAAGEAWEWLEENHPWEGLCLWLGHNCPDCTPCVFVTRENGKTDEDFYVFGQTYPHAIALAVVEAAKVIKENEPVPTP